MIILEGRELGYLTPSGKRLFQKLSFQLELGKMLLVTGPNGSGKSTLLRLLLRQERPTEGTVYSPVPALQVGYIPQLQNMEFHLPLTLNEVIQISHSAPVQTARILDLGLLRSDQLTLTWNTASGGERQRTLLTCALLHQPRLLFLDEPLNHLDQESQLSMISAIGDFLSGKHKGETSVVLVSHIKQDAFHAYDFGIHPLDLQTWGPNASTT